MARGWRMPQYHLGMANKLPETAVCLGCGYSLRGLPGNLCPECWRFFQPRDASTFRGRWHAPTWRLWAKAPPIWQIAVMVALAGTFAWQLSVPGASLSAFLAYSCIFIPLLFGSIIDYFVRVAAVVSDRKRARADRTQFSRRGQWRWTVTPLAILLIFSVMTVHWPLRLRFHWSHAAFEQVATAHLAGMGRNSGPQIIGLYRVERIEVYQNSEVRFVTGWAYIDERGDIDPVGFVYRPDDPWPTDPNRLTFGWYVRFRGW